MFPISGTLNPLNPKPWLGTCTFEDYALLGQIPAEIGELRWLQDTEPKTPTMCILHPGLPPHCGSVLGFRVSGAGFRV